MTPDQCDSVIQNLMVGFAVNYVRLSMIAVVVLAVVVVLVWSTGVRYGVRYSASIEEKHRRRVSSVRAPSDERSGS